MGCVFLADVDRERVSPKQTSSFSYIEVFWESFGMYLNMTLKLSRVFFHHFVRSQREKEAHRRQASETLHPRRGGCGTAAAGLIFLLVAARGVSKSVYLGQIEG
jgi:hypothetical protein